MLEKRYRQIGSGECKVWEKLHIPKSFTDSNSDNKKVEEMLELVEDVVLVDVEVVRTKRRTKDLVTIMIKKIGIIIVPMVVVKILVTMVNLVILDVCGDILFVL